MSVKTRSLCIALLTAMVALAAPAARASEGVLPINQALVDESGFPYTINQPGSYRLVSNLTVPSGFAGIVVNSHDVTIDLNGFSIIGTPGSLDGIEGRPATAYDRITIRNGFVRSMGARGIDIDSESLVERVQAVGNGDIGIRVGGRSVVRDCRVSNNGSAGILALTGSVLINNIVRLNGDDGIAANGNRMTFRSNVIDDNTLHGIDADHEAVVRGNLVSDNGNTGIYTLDNAQITGNLTFDNTWSGIQVRWGATITDNVARSNGAYGIGGVSNPHSAVVMRNAITGNGTAPHQLYDANGLGHNAFDGPVFGDLPPDNYALEPNYCNGSTNCTVIE